MAILDFPSSPTNGQIYPSPAVQGQPQYTYDGEKWVSGTSQGAIYISDSPPAAPVGSLWFESDTGVLYVRYNDGDSTQWVAIPGGPSDAVRYGAQTLTAAQQTIARQNIYAAPFDAMAYSGMQINGSMEVTQENPINTQIGGAGTSVYICDGWRFAYGTAGAAVIRGVLLPAAGGLSGFQNMLSCRVLTAQASMAAGDNAYFVHYIEGYRCSRLAFGTANASPITIGFWVYSAARTGPCSGSLRNSIGDRSYAFTFSINATATWEYKTVTIPGDTSGTWAVGNTVGISLAICIAAGTTFLTAPGAWTAGNFLGATGTTNFIQSTPDILAITGVVVLPGIEAPSAARSPLIMRPYDQELLTCQRYWYIGVPGFQNYGTSGQYYSVDYFHPRVMRATPTGTIVGLPQNTNTSNVLLEQVGYVNYRLTVQAAANGGIGIRAQTTFDARL